MSRSKGGSYRANRPCKASLHVSPNDSLISHLTSESVLYFNQIVLSPNDW
jgi:hypothetical protein